MRVALAARPALAKLIRLLASDVDGEALGAVRALGRALKAHGADFHDLASLVEAPSTAPSGGRTGTGFHDHFGGDDGDPVETEPPWEMMVDACTDQLDRFTPKEQEFLQSMQLWYGTPTPKQFDWLVALFERVQRMT
jgi:hypothetical protein